MQDACSESRDDINSIDDTPIGQKVSLLRLNCICYALRYGASRRPQLTNGYMMAGPRTHGEQGHDLRPLVFAGSWGECPVMRGRRVLHAC